MTIKKMEAIVKGLINAGYLKNKMVSKALLTVPRHEFIPAELHDYAYVDTPLNIGHGQTISAIHMVAIICDALDLKEGDKVLEIGTGSGYHAAVVAEIVGKNGQVITIERIPELAEKAESTLKKLGYTNVKVICGNGTLGSSEFAPYDKIYLTASGPDIPNSLIEQLKKGGKLVAPVGLYIQDLILLEKKNGNIIKKNLGAVAFVPLIGKNGWHNEY
ncbi:protein-L-isoaspartate O-methyltransferase [Methanococcus aeolicus]|uniref:Protein-L-isoaspartate O-methyltransferase n=1 Tax=Methanococcus aeolicus (strain ATCC BAA-1280 / DSM 17508 / OCM 812 / Nankai-3) TaxID=419665 RepID=PIMT_META3|nr:protein-L-isoaspartate O-methyltransferase [Methanococcus aeolicus]A6UWM1.1 RecName: Full=Protein-L-isoaspartate O-methyltransferase; AltName: Full=L-isoaspartyl protein carboxyl methyltransferase; AltName: Full=Protein L-isoaspartyl methyltransferase; AltName: Full=Protein-beta-aspartate methyltransferase; Short=PIMT [Methanococcus aeolicus Nankai-3]ABR56893.1 protein-L-isoaspartate O-methyltransferase [Methanococcus aeolicus Nankai-3]UXM84891.1 protein-L-isoaspartate O-methyltransferase [Me